MITLPSQYLDYPEMRFILSNSDKEPIEKEWNKKNKNNYSHENEYFKKHLQFNNVYGVLCGVEIKINNVPFYLIVIDFDNAEVQNEVFPSLPQTFTVKSAGKGLFHCYFLTDNPLGFKGLDEKNNTLFDVQGVSPEKGEYQNIIGANSILKNGRSYEVAVDTSFAFIKNADLHKLLDPYNHKSLEQKTNGKSNKFLEALNQKQKISALLQEKGINTNKNPTDCPFHTSKGGKCLSFNDTKGLWHCFHCNEGGNTIHLYAKLRNIKVAEAKKELAKKYDISVEQEAKLISCIITEDFLAEQVLKDNKTLFCIYNFADETIDYKEKIELDQEIYTPIISEEVQKGYIKLPSEPLEYSTDLELDTEIEAHIKKWLDIDETHRRFAVYNIRKSWVYDIFHTLNYLRALGDPGSGKSRYLDTIGYLHYKPIATSGALTSAVLFRIIDKWKGTLIIDEADQKKSDEAEDIMKIINQGYEKGRPVMRCNKDNGNTVDFFDTYCPKVIATRRYFDDKATESRCITERMRTTDRKDIPPNLNKEFEKEQQIIRNKLLMWRFKNFKKINPDIGETIDLGDIEPRLRQINTSFVAMFHNNPIELERFKTFLQDYQKELVETRAETVEGKIVTAIAEMLISGEPFINAEKIIQKADLKDKTNELWKSRRLTTYMKVLGFGNAIIKRFENDVKKVYEFDNNLLLTLVRKYVSDEDIKQKFCNYVTNVTITMQTDETVTNTIFNKNEQKNQDSAVSVTTVTTVTKLQEKSQNEIIKNLKPNEFFSKEQLELLKIDIPKALEEGLLFETKKGYQRL